MRTYETNKEAVRDFNEKTNEFINESMKQVDFTEMFGADQKVIIAINGMMKLLECSEALLVKQAETLDLLESKLRSLDEKVDAMNKNVVSVDVSIRELGRDK